MATTASKLRADIYRMLDEVLETGRPLEVERHDAPLGDRRIERALHFRRHGSAVAPLAPHQPWLPVTVVHSR